MTATTATAPITLPDVRKAHHQKGGKPAAATLTPVVDERQGITVYLVSLSPEAARHFGCKDTDGELLADTTIGGLVKDRGGRWDAIAYRDREEFLADRGDYEFVPVAGTSRAHAVRMLMTYYWHRFQAARGEQYALTKDVYRRA